MNYEECKDCQCHDCVMDIGLSVGYHATGLCSTGRCRTCTPEQVKEMVNDDRCGEYIKGDSNDRG